MSRSVLVVRPWARGRGMGRGLEHLARLAGLACRRAAWAIWAALTWRYWVDAVALLFLAGLALYLHRDAVLEGRIFYEKDTWAFYLPLAQRVDAALSQGFLPLWTRSLFAGFPLFADAEAGMLYPLNLLLYSQLDPMEATVWKRVAAFALAGAFMYGFGRAMGFRPFAAAIAGVVFAYGSFLTAQMHHANILQSALWLPLVFCGLELGFRSTGRRRYQWFALGAVALGVQSLAVHPQVVLMTLLAAGLFIGWRAVVGPVAVRLQGAPPGAGFGRRLLAAAGNITLFAINRAFAAGAALVLVVAGGLALGAVQLLPLYELVKFSLRSGGVPYDFASHYSLPLGGLTQLLAPYLFRLPNGQWFIPWATWETTLYAGIPTLVLALTALVFARNRHVWFFLALGVLAVILALGPNSPWNLHKVLWGLPGWDATRAPGRFSLLVVFALAGLAGWGAHWVDTKLTGFWVQEGGRRWQRHWRSGWFGVWVALLLVLPAAAVVGVLLAQGWVQAYPRFALADLSIWTPRPERFDFARFNTLAQQLQALVSLANPSVLLSLALLQVTVVLLAAWYLVPRFGHVWKGALLGVLAFDLLGFAAAYHPQAPVGELAAALPAARFLAENAGDGRVVVRGRTSPLEHNRLFSLSVRSLGGYSSLPPQRHSEYLAPLQGGADTFPDVLADTASVRYVVSPARFTPLPSYGYASYDPGYPLVQGMKENAGSKVTLSGEKTTGDRLHVVAALRDGWDIPQDTPVAELTVIASDGRREPVLLRAGRHVADGAAERPDVKPQLKHAPVEVAFTTPDLAPDGSRYALRVSFAEVPLPRRMEVAAIEYRYVESRGGVRLYGLAVFDSRTWEAGQFRSKTRYREVYRDKDVVIHENVGALPRVYFVNRGEERQAGPHVLAEMQERDFNPRQMVLLEDPLGFGFPREQGERTTAGLAASRPVFRPVETVSSASPMHLEVTYDAPDTGYVVITDSFYPGWRAYLDGQPAPIYRANYLFQAVRTPPGLHRLTLRYEPQSLRTGLDISLVALGLLAGMVATLELTAGVRLGARGLAALRRRAGWGQFPSLRRPLAALRRRLNTIEG